MGLEIRIPAGAAPQETVRTRSVVAAMACRSPHSRLLAPPSSQPSETKAHQKRRAGFGHRNQRPACGYGIEAGAGEVRVDVVESGS